MRESEKEGVSGLCKYLIAASDIYRESVKNHNDGLMWNEYVQLYASMVLLRQYNDSLCDGGSCVDLNACITTEATLEVCELRAFSQTFRLDSIELDLQEKAQVLQVRAR